MNSLALTVWQISWESPPGAAADHASYNGTLSFHGSTKTETFHIPVRWLFVPIECLEEYDPHSGLIGSQQHPLKLLHPTELLDLSRLRSGDLSVVATVQTDDVQVRINATFQNFVHTRSFIPV